MAKFTPGSTAHKCSMREYAPEMYQWILSRLGQGGGCGQCERTGSNEVECPDCRAGRTLLSRIDGDSDE